MAAARRDRDGEADEAYYYGAVPETKGKAGVINARPTSSTAAVHSLFGGSVAASSSPDVLEKSPGPPLVLVISSDEETELELFSSRRPVRCGSGAARLRSSASSPIVISSSEDEEEENTKTMSSKRPSHHYNSHSHYPHFSYSPGSGSGAHRNRLERSRSRSPRRHKQTVVGPGLQMGQNRGDPVIISSDSDPDFSRSRSPFKSSSHKYTRNFDGPPHLSPHYPHARHRPPPHPFPSRHLPHRKPSSKPRHRSNSPRRTKQRMASDDYLVNSRDAPNNIAASPHRQISRNSPREQYVSPHRRPDSRMSPPGQGGVISPRSLPSGSPFHHRKISHLHNHHPRAEAHSSHVRVSPPTSSSCAGSSSVWHHSSNITTEYTPPERVRHHHNGYYSLGSTPEHRPPRLPLVKQECLVRELSRTPSPPPPHSPPSQNSPISPPPSAPCTPPPSHLSPYNPDAPSGCSIPRQSPLLLTQSSKKKRRQLFTEEDRKVKREHSVNGTPVSKVDIDRRQTDSVSVRTLSHETSESGKSSSVIKREKPEKSLLSHDSTPEISPVQNRKGKRKLSTRLSSQDSRKQTRLERYFSDDRDITPPLEPNNLFSLGVVCEKHQKLVPPVKGTTLPAPRVTPKSPAKPAPRVMLKSPAKPACEVKQASDASASRHSMAHPLPSSSHSQSPTSRVKRELGSTQLRQEHSVKEALPSINLLPSTAATSFRSVGVETKCSKLENLPQPTVTTSSCAVHKLQALSPPLPHSALCVDHQGAPPPAPPAEQGPAIPAWSDTELEMKGESQSVSLDLLGVELVGLALGDKNNDSTFPPAPKSSWNYVVVQMNNQRRQRDDTKFVESLEYTVSKGFCIPDAQIGVILKHVRSVSDQSLLLRLHSVLTTDSSSRRSVNISPSELWNLTEDCCRQLSSSGTPSSPPRSSPGPPHVVLLYLVSLLVTDATAASTSNVKRMSLIEQTLSLGSHWRRVRVLVDLLFVLLVQPQPSPSPLPNLLPLLTRLLSVCASLVLGKASCGDGAMRLARELSSRMSKLSSMQLKMELLLLIPCYSLREKIINIHLQTEFPLFTTSLGHTPLDHVTLELIAATHFHRCPTRRGGSPQDLPFFLALLFHLLQSHCSRLLDPATATLSFSHPLPSPLPCSPTSTSHPVPSPSRFPSSHPPQTSAKCSHSLLSPCSPHRPFTSSSTNNPPPFPSSPSTLPTSPTSSFTALSPSDLARRLAPISKEIRGLFQRLSEDESLLQELTSPDSWFYLQLLQNMFSWQHITE